MYFLGFRIYDFGLGKQRWWRPLLAPLGLILFSVAV